MVGNRTKLDIATGDIPRTWEYFLVSQDGITYVYQIEVRHIRICGRAFHGSVIVSKYILTERIWPFRGKRLQRLWEFSGSGILLHMDHSHGGNWARNIVREKALNSPRPHLVVLTNELLDVLFSPLEGTLKEERDRLREHATGRAVYT